MNFHAYSGADHLGDLRIWRGRGRETFQRRDLDLLDAIGTAFGNALANLRLEETRQREADPQRRFLAWAEKHGLTAREKDVLALLSQGKRDPRDGRRSRGLGNDGPVPLEVDLSKIVHRKPGGNSGQSERVSLPAIIVRPPHFGGCARQVSRICCVLFQKKGNTYDQAYPPGSSDSRRASCRPRCHRPGPHRSDRLGGGKSHRGQEIDRDRTG